MNSNKKAKTDDNAFSKVRKYLLACPDVPDDHPAIQAALRGLAQEEQRHIRDAKLQQKFSKTTKNPEISPAQSTDTDLEVIDHVEEGPRRSSPHSASGEDLPDDWHEVPADQTPSDDYAASLGEALAHATVQSLAQHQVRVREPWQALAVALHGALRSDLLDFRCTGKEQDQAASGGFAPPARELPATTFLPPNLWSNPNLKTISLRYRKPGLGDAVVLTVAEIQGDNNEACVSVAFGPSKSSETMAEPLRVKIADYINLDSFMRASNGGKAVPPSLHYKQLSAFMTSFCQCFDVGAIHDSAEGSAPNEAESLPYVDRSIACGLPRPDPAGALPTTVPPLHQRPVEPWMREQYQPPTIESAFGLRVPGHGDFAGDLVPGGLSADPMRGGNLMGPDHPMFAGGPHGMTPRFDPFGPPQPDALGGTRGGGSVGRGGPSQGRPNPDHMRPPNNLNNNMFM